MPRLNESQLIQKTKTLTTNGLNPLAQAILASINYTPPELAFGMGYAETVAEGRAETKAAKSAQTRATRNERMARLAAQKEAISFSETARILFADDPPTLLALGLQTQYETVTNPETGESKQVAVQPSRGTSEVIARWTNMYEGTKLLNAPLRNQLAAAGWNEDRIDEAQLLVDAYSAADIAQQAAIQAYEARSAQQIEDAKTLRNWYSKASRLCKIAIKDADPTNAQQILELLGLDRV